MYEGSQKYCGNIIYCACVLLISVTFDAWLMFNSSFVKVDVGVFVQIEYRPVIKLLHLKSNSPTQIKAKVTAPSFGKVKFWQPNLYVVADERSGWPTTAATTDKIGQVHQMVPDDYQIKLRDSRGCWHLERTCLSCALKWTFQKPRWSSLSKISLSLSID